MGELALVSSVENCKSRFSGIADKPGMLPGVQSLDATRIL